MWRETSEERYHEMLGCLPPALLLSHGFLVGEPMYHRLCTVTIQMAPAFAAFVYYNAKYYESARPLTTAEFRAFKASDLLLSY